MYCYTLPLKWMICREVCVHLFSRVCCICVCVLYMSVCVREREKETKKAREWERDSQVSALCKRVQCRRSEHIIQLREQFMKGTVIIIPTILLVCLTDQPRLGYELMLDIRHLSVCNVIFRPGYRKQSNTVADLNSLAALWIGVWANGSVAQKLLCHWTSGVETQSARLRGAVIIIAGLRMQIWNVH